MSESSKDTGCFGCVLGLVGLIAVVWIVTHPIVFATGIWNFINQLFS